MTQHTISSYKVFNYCVISVSLWTSIGTHNIKWKKASFKDVLCYDLISVKLYMQRKGLEVHISRRLLSLHICGWNYVCSFFLFPILRIFFSVMIMCVRLREKKPKSIFKFPSCRSYLRRPNNISSLRHVITSNNNFFPLKIISLTYSSSLECFSPILFMGHLSQWWLSHFSKGSYSLFLCNKLS